MDTISPEKKFLLTLSDQKIRQLLAYMMAQQGSASTSAPVPASQGEKFQLPESAATKLTRLKEQRKSGRRLDRDDSTWLEYVQEIETLRCDTVNPALQNCNDRACYTFLMEQCQARHLPVVFTEEIVSSVMEYLQTGYTRPIILHGTPGCGKTKAATLLAEIIGKQYFLTSATTADMGHGMLGEGSSFKSADCGELWRGILQAKCLNPVLIIDEIDKITRTDSRMNLQDEWLTILNDQTLTFRDNFLGFPHSLQGSLIIFTCNDLHALSEPFRDRCVVYTFADVEVERLTSIIEEYAVEKWEKTYKNSLVFSQSALENGIRALYRLDIHSIRKHKALVDDAFKAAQRIFFTTSCASVEVSEDIYRQQIDRLVESRTARRSIGF